MKISPNLYGRMDGSKFLGFPWFPENSLLCVILRYTVYILYHKTVLTLAGYSHIFELTFKSIGQLIGNHTIFQPI